MRRRVAYEEEAVVETEALGHFEHAAHDIGVRVPVGDGPREHGLLVGERVGARVGCLLGGCALKHLCHGRVHLGEEVQN